MSLSLTLCTLLVDEKFVSICVHPRTFAARKVCGLPRREQRSQMPRPFRRPQLPQRFRFDLADPLPRDVELLADLFERMLALASDAEAQTDHLLLLGRKRLQDVG